MKLKNPALDRKVGLSVSYTLALMMLLMIASSSIPQYGSAASSTKRASAVASASSYAKPLPPVRICSPLDDIVIEGGGPVTCGGACQHQSMYCTQNNVYIMMVSGCCAKCCVNGTENCSEPTCCDP